jgi:hypothetical protein
MDGVGGGHKVRAGGPGLVRAECGEPATFNVYSREAGHGTLTFAVEGPDKARMKWNDLNDGNGYARPSTSSASHASPVPRTAPLTYPASATAAPTKAKRDVSRDIVLRMAREFDQLVEDETQAAQRTYH